MIINDSCMPSALKPQASAFPRSDRKDLRNGAPCPQIPASCAGPLMLKAAAAAAAWHRHRHPHEQDFSSLLTHPGEAGSGS